jgi:hypothetical protein
LGRSSPGIGFAENSFLHYLAVYLAQALDFFSTKGWFKYLSLHAFAGHLNRKMKPSRIPNAGVQADRTQMAPLV